MQNFRFLLPFLINLEKLQMLTHLDPFDVGASHGQCIRLAQLHSDAVDFPKTRCIFSYESFCMIQIMRIFEYFYFNNCKF